MVDPIYGIEPHNIMLPGLVKTLWIEGIQTQRYKRKKFKKRNVVDQAIKIKSDKLKLRKIACNG